MAAVVEYGFTLDVTIFAEVSEDVEDDLRRTGACRFMRNKQNSLSRRLVGFFCFLCATENPETCLSDLIKNSHSTCSVVFGKK